MKFLVLVNPGIEELAIKELSNYKIKNTKNEPAAIIIETTIEEIIRIAYKAQSINRILLLFDSFQFKDDFEKKLEKIKLIYLNKKQTFAARSEHLNNTSLSNNEIQQTVGAFVAKKIGTKVNLSHPDITIFTFINKNKAYIGIDLTDDLSKRDYRIYMQRDQLKATVAFASLLFSEWTPEKNLLASFCNTGLIPIEAALASTNTSPHFYKKEKFLFHKIPDFKNAVKQMAKEDTKITKPSSQIHAIDQSMRQVEAAKKNAKIAGINKAIQFSRKELSWFDTKFGEASIDRVVCVIPQPSKLVSEEKIEKLYHEFFYQCKYILKKDGKICLITKYPDLLLEDAKRHNFKEEKRLKVTQGKDELTFVLFSK